MLRGEDAKRLRLNNLKANTAFTLAEVLITLGIIGVVAAITLPTLLNKIYDRQNIARWKQAYSLVSNVFYQTLNEGVAVCDEYYLNGNCQDAVSGKFRDKMMEKLKVVDYCTLLEEKRCDNYNEYYHELLAKHKWAGIANMYSRYKALGVKSKFNDSYSPYGINAYNFMDYAYLLNNGAVLYFGSTWGGPWIVVDVNNFFQGPNEIGRDVFIIKVYSNNKTNQNWIKPAGAQGTPNWNDSSSGSSGCSKDIGLKQTNNVYDAAGAGCSAKYIME